MFNYQLIEITTDIQSLAQYKFDEENKKKYCLIFIHYNKEDYINEYQFVKEFEKNTGYWINWINAEQLYDGYKKLNNQLNANALFDISDEQSIKEQIKEFVFDKLIRTGKYYK